VLAFENKSPRRDHFRNHLTWGDNRSGRRMRFGVHSPGMVAADEIIDYIDRIAIAFKPHRILLFGSYAYGVPTNDSDVDLLITRRRWSMSPLTAAGRIRIELGVPFPMDLIVRSEADIDHRLSGADFFIREILEKGTTLYAADDARMGRQGRVRLRRRMRGASLAQEVPARSPGKIEFVFSPSSV
jgi:uncharacterized protein